LLNQKFLIHLPHFSTETGILRVTNVVSDDANHAIFNFNIRAFVTQAMTYQITKKKKNNGIKLL